MWDAGKEIDRDGSGTGGKDHPCLHDVAARAVARLLRVDREGLDLMAGQSAGSRPGGGIRVLRGIDRSNASWSSSRSATPTRWRT